ncbi:[protein-PII] uridylyltransferase [Geothermobacter hydrogeniphilus]|uniref:Bifunctional uridylyltransferase/uridylyl-removing enzyme n=1 Tax=Geothermobacter hydrogeniphilus TaxID=1969733 RepID=A0A1X0YEA0_9BACT|nr:[protein-PII] uridylyltransferase [Geothermobacter hydrogeniphilus]ORJ63439.1 [protein-PII] uridylyltransferase [Geothermobacter hydrogeniphilus]
MPSSIDSCFASPRLTDTALPYEERRVLLLQASRDYLERERAAVRRQHEQGASGREVVRLLTVMTDELIRRLYHAVAVDLTGVEDVACALLAIGGYGRAELNPRSDIDLMFYYHGRDRSIAEQISERMLYLLWDLALDVGYSVRTAADCIEMADRDITARTALLDARYLAGSESLFEDFEKQVLGIVLGKNSNQFIRHKQEESQRRLTKYGSTVYLLEPNIKEGEGGLRDLQAAVWILRVKFKASGLRELVIKGVMTEQEKEAVENACDYLWRIRNQLHYLSSRKNDQLHFEQQEQIARFLGYRDSKKAPAVEEFMQDYYSHATQVEHLASVLINRAANRDQNPSFFSSFSKRKLEDGFYLLRRELRAGKPELFEQNPILLMRAFLLAQRHGVVLSLDLKTLIRDHLHLINDQFRRSREVNRDFFEILRGQSCGQILRDMHHLRFLNAYIPEFERIYCRVQHDAYHIYTVDIHTLFAVEEILKLWAGEYAEERPLLTAVANDIEKRELLLLAVLFHDIGKGEGKNHSEKGAKLVRTIARRMGLNKEDSERLEFLVLHHLEMAHISQRRDLHDDKLIDQVARSMGMTENLKMLFLLTFADLRAVGPDVWSEWKGFLLQELYEKTFDALERGNFRADARSERVRNRKRKVYDNLAEDFGRSKVKAVLRSLGSRYLLSHRSPEITEHLRVYFGRGKKPLAMRVEHQPGSQFSQLMLSTLDSPGLFSLVAGVLAANGVSILGAQIYTHKNGEAFDLLQVVGSNGEIIDNPRRWQKVEQELTAVIEGRLQVDALVEKSRPPSFLSGKALPQYPSRVEFDTEVSDDYTVVDIYTHDRVGLLYEITRSFADLGLYIGVSKISTKVDQVADTFYLQDIFGQKITAEDKLDELRRVLLDVLEDKTTEGSAAVD